MPIISVTMGQGQTTKQQKKQLIESFTNSAMEIIKLPAHTFTILINELNGDCIGIGGKPLETIHEIQQK